MMRCGLNHDKDALLIRHGIRIFIGINMDGIRLR